jgi:hypothetical protein
MMGKPWKGDYFIAGFQKVGVSFSSSLRCFSFLNPPLFLFYLFNSEYA